MIYDAGDLVQLSTVVRDLTGTTVNTPTVTLTITKPDGSTTSPSITNTGAGGIYTATVTVDQAGTWTYLWVSSGTVTAKEPGQFSVTSPRVLVASFEEFRAHLNRTDITDDAELRTFLVSATDYVEYHIGGPVGVQTFTESVRPRAGLITPLKRPLVSVTSLTPELGTAIDSSSYAVDTSRGVIRILYGSVSSPTGWYTLVYRAGLSTMQERHKVAGLIIAAHLWQVQNGGGGLPFPGDTETPQYWMGFAIPNRAKELLAPDVFLGFA